MKFQIHFQSQNFKAINFSYKFKSKFLNRDGTAYSLILMAESQFASDMLKVMEMSG